MKLQDAFIAESGAYVGSWNKIGYKGPGTVNAAGTATGGASTYTTNFTYAESATFSADGTTDLVSGGTIGWQAGNKSKLNDCAISTDGWKVTVTKGTGGDYTWAATVTDATNCGSLTPTFDKIGK